MTTMLSLILAFMLTMGGSPAVSISPVNSIEPESGVNCDITGKPRLGEFQKIYPVVAKPKAGNPRLVLNLSFQYKKSPLINLNQAFGMNPVNFVDPFGLLTQDQRNKVRQQVFQLLMSGDEGSKNTALAALQNYQAEFGALTQEDIGDIFGENDSILDATFVTMRDILNLGGAKIALGMEDLSTNYNIYTREDFMGFLNDVRGKEALALRWNTEGMIGTYNSVVGNISRINRIRKASGKLESHFSSSAAKNRRFSYIELTPGNYEEILSEQMSLEGTINAWAVGFTSAACILAVRSKILAMQKRMGIIRVGRWMSETEFQKMLDSNFVQKSKGNMTHITNPANPDAFKAAKPGSIYVEFDVPASSVVPGGKEGWGIIPGSGSIYDKLNIRKGLPGYKMPKATNIQILKRK
jgi:hypothetical protein